MPVLPGLNAATYCPNDAIALVQAFGHGLPLSQANLAANLCDIINSNIWNFYAWSWSRNTLTPIPCSNGVQDYIATDTDILRPTNMRIVRTDVSPSEFRELSYIANLAPELSVTGGIDSIRAIGYFAGINTFRLSIAANIGSGQTMEIQGEYQVIPTKINEKDLQIPFLFPDRFFPCFVEGLKWKVYQLADDPRAGGMTISNVGGKVGMTMSGQYGTFCGALIQMARTEDLSEGDLFNFPDSPMGAQTGASWFGVYGF